LRADPAFIAAQIADAVPNWRRIVWPKHQLRKLARQKRAVPAGTTRERGCIVMPTGTGKTEVALS